MIAKEKHIHYEQQKLSLVTYLEDLGKETTEVILEFDLHDTNNSGKEKQ